MSEILRKQLTYRVDSVLARRNPLRWQESEALLKIRSMRARYIPEEIPANLKQFASAIGIKDVRYVPLPVRGRLVSEGHYLAAEINEQLSEDHRRLVLAHEIAHVILETEHLGKLDQQKLANRLDQPRSEREYRRLENLCDEAAKEILVPVHLMRSTVGGKPASLEVLLTLAHQAQAWPEVVASQILRAREWDCRFYWWRHMDDRWKAIRSVPPRPERELVWLDIVDPSKSIVERAHREQQLVSGPVTLLDSGGSQRYEKAEASPYGENSVLLMILLGVKSQYRCKSVKA